MGFFIFVATYDIWLTESTVADITIEALIEWF